MTKTVAIIQYEHNVGGQIADRWMWLATVDGEVYDYNRKDVLKRDLEKDGYAWQVIRKHRNGSKTVIERSE